MAYVDLGQPLGSAPAPAQIQSGTIAPPANTEEVETKPLPPSPSISHNTAPPPYTSQPLDSVSHAHPSTATGDSTSTAPPTSTIDPNVPSSQSAPTALPTNAATHPEEQKEAIKHEHPAVIGREVEKTKAAEREIKGEPAEGTVVKGLEDDRLYAMLRRFDAVSLLSRSGLLMGKWPMSVSKRDEDV